MFCISICEDEIDNIDTEISYKYMNIHEYKPTFKSYLKLEKPLYFFSFDQDI